MKKRMVLEIRVALLFAGINSAVQAQTIPHAAGAILGNDYVGHRIDKMIEENRRIDEMLHHTPGPTLGGSTAPLSGISAVVLSNEDRAPVNFTLTGDACSQPLYASLVPYHYNTYTCPGAQAFEITLITPHVNGSVITKRYSLLPEKTYGLIWNGEEADWNAILK